MKFSSGPVLRALLDLEDKPQWVDVTSTAHQFLFEPVELDGITLQDVFGLLDRDPILVQVLRRYFVQELLEHARKGALQHDNSYDPQGIEYLELYQCLGLDTSTRTVTQDQHVQFHGVGFEMRQDEEMDDYIQPKGTRINWGVGLTDVREMLHLPVRVRYEVPVEESDVDSVRFGQKLHTVMRSELTLGQVLHGILWELSFYGGPKGQADVREELHEAVRESDEAGPGPAQGDCGLDSLEALDRPGLGVLFESMGSLRGAQIMQALRKVEDEEPVLGGLARVLGEAKTAQLRVRPEYADLPGRRFRKALREARSKN